MGVERKSVPGYVAGDDGLLERPSPRGTRMGEVIGDDPRTGGPDETSGASRLAQLTSQGDRAGNMHLVIAPDHPLGEVGEPDVEMGLEDNVHR